MVHDMIYHIYYRQIEEQNNCTHSLQLLKTFLHCSSIWHSHVSCLSTLIPTNITSVCLSVLFLPKFKTKKPFSFVLRTINWNLKINLEPTQKIIKIFKITKLHTSSIVITKNKLFIIKFKSRVLRMKPLGTPLTVSYHELCWSTFWFPEYGEKNTQESKTMLWSSQFYNILIWV